MTLAVVTLLGLSVLIFGLSSVGGDPAEQMAAHHSADAQATPQQIAQVRHELGIDRPVVVRYFSWLGGALGGDFGSSLYAGRSVNKELGKAFPYTFILAITALFLIVALGIPMAVAGALFHPRWEDQVLRLLVLIAASIPGFFLAYLLVNLLAVRLHLLPAAGADRAASVILPAVTLAVAPAMMVARLMRGSLLEVYGDDYIRTARSKGLSAVSVMLRHAFRNAFLPTLTVLGSVLGRMLEGAVVIEVIFAWPGLGLLTYNAILSYDYPVVVGAVLLGGLAFVLLNLVVDFLYALVDPRVRVGVRI